MPLSSFDRKPITLGRGMALLLFLGVCIFSHGAFGQNQVVFSRDFDGSGNVLVSSWLDPDGSDSDMYAYDDFTLPTAQAITQVRWRGGYSYAAAYGHVSNFTITFYESIAGGSQPHLTNPQLPEIYLAHYNVGGIAGETAAGTFGGIAMYDYSYTLSSPFLAAAGTKYWIRIEGVQAGYPDWGLASGSGGDGQHFQFSTGAARFYFGQHDCAFSLLASAGPSCTIAASALPDTAGSITGAGVYPLNSTANLAASSNPGFGFVNWTENGTVVSSSANYSFKATVNRTLVAHFAPTYNITTSVAPFNGGTTSGDGSYVGGRNVSVSATANTGFAFVNWTEAGTEVSTSATYTFAAGADRFLTANFVQTATVVLFDLDTGTPQLVATQGLPVSQSVGGLTAQFTGVGLGGFSIQSDGTTFYHLSLFSGNYIYPNSLDRDALDIRFSQPLTNVSLKFATADFHQVEIPTSITLTAYNNSTANAPVGSISAHGSYGSDTMPMGEIAFAAPAGQTFNLVEITIPYQPQGSTDFFVDNITAITHSVASFVVPNIVGLDQATAASQVTASGLLQGTVSTAMSSTVAAGLVIEQNPLGGSSAFPGTSVDYTVSLGAPLSVSVLNPPPTIKAGGYAELSVLAQNGHGTVSYQWYKRDGAALNAVTGANSDVLAFDSVSDGDGGVYLCEVSDDYDTLQSADIVLNVATALPTMGTAGLVLLCLILARVSVSRTGRALN